MAIVDVRFKNPWAGDTEDAWSPYYSIEMFDQLATVLGAVGTYTENYKGLRDEDRASFNIRPSIRMM